MDVVEEVGVEVGGRGGGALRCGEGLAVSREARGGKKTYEDRREKRVLRCVWKDCVKG